MIRVRPLFAVAAVSVLTLLSGTGPADAAASHALIQGSGSSWAANAVNTWVADVDSQGVKVVFTPNGSGQGRKDYANQSTDFGVSDVPFQGTDPKTGQADTSLGRSFAYLPIAAGGTSFPYHLDIGTQRVRNLRLSGETLAKIFTSVITNWNDPQIAKDNNGRALPSLPIIPVVHAEPAGVSEQFTRYLSRGYPAIWSKCNGSDAETEYYPTNCGQARGNMRALNGSDGVMNFIKSSGANGSIGMEEYSYPLLSNFPAAKVLNKAGYYTLPTQYNVAVALTKAEINYDKSSPNYLIQNLDDVYTNPDKRTYPLSSYVYAIIPTAANDQRMTTAKRQTIADFLYYSICQGQSEIGPIGYSSLPINLVQAGFEQIGKLKSADPKVDLTSRDVASCHNPTFIAGQPKVNHLAVIAPQPPACDRSGAGPCSASVGAYNGPTSGAKNANNGGGSGGAGTSGTGGAGTTGSGSGTGGGGTGSTSGTIAGGGTGGAATTGTGLGGATGAGGANPLLANSGGGTNGGAGTGDGTADDTIDVVPTTLAANDSTGSGVPLILLAIGLLLAAVAVPILLGRGRTGGGDIGGTGGPS